MFFKTIPTMIVLSGLFLGSSAQAECSGGNGRGWASGNGSGQFEMRAADKSCQIDFVGFYIGKTRVPATEVVLRQAPKSGKVGIAPGRGLVYTPNPGFKGRDRFCTRNSSPKVKGKTLSGCISIDVR